jgi:hypothetical protein
VEKASVEVFALGSVLVQKMPFIVGDYILKICDKTWVAKAPIKVEAKFIGKAIRKANLIYRKWKINSKLLIINCLK